MWRKMSSSSEEVESSLLASNLTELLFVADEFERICHMKGLDELRRQLAAGLELTRKTGESKFFSNGPRKQAVRIL